MYTHTVRFTGTNDRQDTAETLAAAAFKQIASIGAHSKMQGVACDGCDIVSLLYTRNAVVFGLINNRKSWVPGTNALIARTSITASSAAFHQTTRIQVTISLKIQPHLSSKLRRSGRVQYHSSVL